MSTYLPGLRRIANSLDYSKVAICFEDQEINLLFSELLEVRGVETVILNSISDFSGESKLVTEPQFFSAIDQRFRGQCLLVGNREALRGLPAHSLCRPLTEDKVESAIHKLLSS